MIYDILWFTTLQIKQMLEGVLSNATNDFIFNDTSFLPQNAQNALEEFRNASVDQINITGEVVLYIQLMQCNIVLSIKWSTTQECVSPMIPI